MAPRYSADNEPVKEILRAFHPLRAGFKDSPNRDRPTIDRVADDSPEATTNSGKVVVLMPVYDDWAALSKVIDEVDVVLRFSGFRVAVLAVDDGSPTMPHWNEDRSYVTLTDVSVLRLRRNLGHQRAIAVALAYVEANLKCDIVVIMDADGEDDPNDIPRLLEECRRTGGDRIVFAERTRRSESWMFRFFYVLFRIIHRLLTGHRVRVGNFSVVPRNCLKRLVVVPELWSHYAAAVFVSGQPFTMIPTARASRLDGTSRMNFVSLVAHGLSAISVFSEVVGVRLLLVCAVLALLALVGVGAVVTIRTLTALAIPGWATYSVGLLSIALLQAVMFSIIFCFVILSGRKSATFIPSRDSRVFVDEVRRLWTRA